MLLYLGRCAVATVAVCGFGRWFGVSLRAATSNLPSSPDHPIPSQSLRGDWVIRGRVKQTCAPAYKTVDFSQSNAHVVQICRSSLSAAVQTVQVERRTSPFNGIERSLSRAVVIKTKSLCPSPLPRFQQPYLCTSRKMGESINTIQHSPRKSMSYKFAAPRYGLPPMALQTVQGALNLAFQRRRTKRKWNDRSVVS